MIRAFIIDDEEHAVVTLQLMLDKFCKDVMLIGTAHSVREGAAMIRQSMPDVVFLDVEMRDESGFDLLKYPFVEQIAVVFTTAHDQYAIQALKKGARDYLLKPVDPDELVEAIQKVKAEKINKAAQSLDRNETLYINTDTASLALKTADIIYICADGRYSELFCIGDRKLVVCKNIGEYEEELHAHGFFRIHKSALVNLGHVHQLKKGHSNTVEMKNGTQLPISRRKKTELMNLLAGEG